jgi:hypothetical protein
MPNLNSSFYLIIINLKCLWNEIFASFFIVLLKGTAQMMKNNVYSLFVSHLIPNTLVPIQFSSNFYVIHFQRNK